MSIKLGTESIKAIKLGENTLKRIYVNGKVVWPYIEQAAPEPPAVPSIFLEGDLVSQNTGLAGLVSYYGGVFEFWDHYFILDDTQEIASVTEFNGNGPDGKTGTEIIFTFDNPANSGVSLREEFVAAFSASKDFNLLGIDTEYIDDFNKAFNGLNGMYLRLPSLVDLGEDDLHFNTTQAGYTDVSQTDPNADIYIPAVRHLPAKTLYGIKARRLDLSLLESYVHFGTNETNFGDMQYLEYINLSGLDPTAANMSTLGGASDILWFADLIDNPLHEAGRPKPFEIIVPSFYSTNGWQGGVDGALQKFVDSPDWTVTFV